MIMRNSIEHTGFREEGGESMVIIGALALFGEVAIGLVEESASHLQCIGEIGLPGCRARGSRAVFISLSVCFSLGSDIGVIWP
jgi:hypothetical protein